MSSRDQHTQPEDNDFSETNQHNRDEHNPNDQFNFGNSPPSSSITGSRHHYHGIAASLLFIGVGFLILALLLGGTDVLFVLGGIGIFGGVLSYYLTLDRFVSAEVSKQIHAAAAGSYEGICTDLDLSERHIYVPVKTSAVDGNNQSAPDQRAVRLFIPKQSDMDLRETAALKLDSFVVTDSTRVSGLSIQPTGGGLFTEFTTVLNGSVENSPRGLYQQLSDAVVKEFGLARSVTAEISPEQGRMCVTFSDVLYDTHSRFDHPLVSVFAVGLAIGLDAPVETTQTDTDSFSVTFNWPTSIKTSKYNNAD